MPSLFSWILRENISGFRLFSWRFLWSLFCLFRVRREFLRNRRCKDSTRNWWTPKNIGKDPQRQAQVMGLWKKHKVSRQRSGKFYCSFRFLLRSSSSLTKWIFALQLHISSIPFLFWWFNLFRHQLQFSLASSLMILIPCIFVWLLEEFQFFRCFSWSDARKTKSRKRKSSRTITTRNDVNMMTYILRGVVVVSQQRCLPCKDSTGEFHCFALVQQHVKEKGNTEKKLGEGKAKRDFCSGKEKRGFGA